MTPTDADLRFEQHLEDGWAQPLPQLMPRAVELAALPGKTDAVVGMRRVGKTSLLLYHLQQRLAAGVPRRRLVYVNFEDDRLAGVQLADLDALYRAALRLYPGAPGDERWFYLDEIQNVPGWERFVRRLVDTPGCRIAVTGSSSRLLSSEIATSLRGRALTTELLPFSFAEALRFAGGPIPARLPTHANEQAHGEAFFSRYLTRGGFPELQNLDEGRCAAVLRDYVDVVVLRDVIERHGVTNAVALRTLTRRLLSSPAGTFSANRFTQDLRAAGISVSRETTLELVQHLEEAYLLFTVPIATDSERQRFTNPRKIYPVDPSLSVYTAFRRSENLGHLLEALVYLELRRRGYDLAWVRTRSGFEVDFLARHLERGTLLVQVCWDLAEPGTRERELRALEEAAEEWRADEALIVTRAMNAHLSAGKLDVAVRPAWWWLLEDTVQKGASAVGKPEIG
jgi:predicted AAA+ superfamily ATPase